MNQSEAASVRLPRCPSCGQPVIWSGNAGRPFCSITCKLIDLGRWLDGGYRIPGPALSTETDRPDRAESDTSA